MILDKILDFLYPKIFINIIASNAQSTVFVETISKGKILSSEEEIFSTGTLNTKMIDYIKKFINQTPYYYISILDKSLDQGLIPTCSDLKKYVENPANISTICEEKKHMYYTSQYDLKELQRDYKSIGLDFVFSPFSILNKFFADKIDDNLAIFLLIEHRTISLSIFNKSKLLFSQYLNVEDDMSSDSLSMDGHLDDEISLEIDGINLDDIDVDDDVSSLEDFSDIEDLDTGLEIDEFSEDEDIEEITNHHDNIEIESDEFNEDYKRFILIQESINTFYKDDKYDSEFIENIYIADAIGTSKDLKKYLEEEMFLSVIIRKVDLAQELCDMAKAELQ